MPYTGARPSRTGESGSRRQGPPRRSGPGARGSRSRNPRLKPERTGTAGGRSVHLNGRSGCGEGTSPKMGPRRLPEDRQAVNAVPQFLFPFDLDGQSFEVPGSSRPPSHPSHQLPEQRVQRCRDRTSITLPPHRGQMVRHWLDRFGSPVDSRCPLGRDNCIWHSHAFRRLTPFRGYRSPLSNATSAEPGAPVPPCTPESRGKPRDPVAPSWTLPVGSGIPGPPPGVTRCRACAASCF